MKAWLTALIFLLSVGIGKPTEVFANPNDYRCPDGKSYPVHLSFDDGPHPQRTAMILRALKNIDPSISATFFILLEKFKFVLERHPNDYSAKQKSHLRTLKKLQSLGHEIGSHTFKHINHAQSSKYSQADIQKNLDVNLRIWQQLALPLPAPLRFPYGAGWFKERNGNNESLRKLALNQVIEDGFFPMHWDIDSWDWSKHKRKLWPHSILQQICSHKGGVILFHDTMKATAEQLEPLLKAIQSAGHQFVDRQTIQQEAEVQRKPWRSFALSATGLFYCHRPVSDVDQIWGSCDEYEQLSSDLIRMQAGR